MSNNFIPLPRCIKRAKQNAAYKVESSCNEYAKRIGEVVEAVYLFSLAAVLFGTAKLYKKIGDKLC